MCHISNVDITILVNAHISAYGSNGILSIQQGQALDWHALTNGDDWIKGVGGFLNQVCSSSGSGVY